MPYDRRYNLSSQMSAGRSAMNERKTARPARLQAPRNEGAPCAMRLPSFDGSDRRPLGKDGAAAQTPAVVDQAVLGHACVKLFARDPQEFGGVSFIMTGNSQSSFDEFALGFVEGSDRSALRRIEDCGAVGGGVGVSRLPCTRRRARIAVAHAGGQVFEPDSRTAAEDDRTLDGVGELAHIARPLISKHDSHGFLRDASDRHGAGGLGTKRLDEVADEQRDILAPLA